MVITDAVLQSMAVADGPIDKLELSGLVRPAEKARLAVLQAKIVAASENLSGREALELFGILERYWAKTGRKSA